MKTLEYLDEAIVGFIASRAGGGADSSPEGRKTIKGQERNMEETIYGRQQKQKNDGQNARKRHLQATADEHEEEKKRKRAFTAAKLNMDISFSKTTQTYATCICCNNTATAKLTIGDNRLWIARGSLFLTPHNIQQNSWQKRTPPSSTR